MKIKRKSPAPIKIIRRITQIVAFVLFPGLFIFVFSAIKDVYTALISGTFGVTDLLPQLTLIFAVFLVTVIMGRFFCGFLCAFGAMSDFFWFLSPKPIKNRFRISEKTDHILKFLKYGVLLFIVGLIWTTESVMLAGTASPWTIFGMYASVTGWPAAANLLSIGALLLLFIIIGSMVVERFFCRYLCPLGGIFSLASQLRLFRIKKPRSQCGNCRVCTRQCAMGISLYQNDTVASGECIDCFACVEACPRGNVTANPVPTMAAAAAVITITGLYYAGNLVSQNNVAEATTPDIVVADSAYTTGQYTDGVYSGSAAGYKGTTEVEVTVANGNITGIDVVATDDDREFFDRAANTVISSILGLQSTEVDTVSGATFSSLAVINAVADALDSAGASRDIVLSQISLTSDEAADSPSLGADIGFEDGVYSGIGTGFNGNIEVSVKVENNQISEITVLSSGDDAPYFNLAESSTISSIIESQSVDVATVSGATYSSAGIIEAVADALGLEYANIADATEKEITSGHRGNSSN